MSILGLMVLACNRPSKVNEPMANGAFLRVEGIKLLLRFRELHGRWPKATDELMKSGILPATVVTDPNLKTKLLLDDQNFVLDEIRTKDKNQILLRFRIGNATFTEENSLSALRSLR